MHITKFTDYALRTLMYLGHTKPTEMANINEISDVFGISRNHLMKVVNRLGTLGLLQTIRGRSGGIRLNKAIEQINVGFVIRELESTEPLFDCAEGPCLFIGVCNLDRALRRAVDAFLNEMDRYTLADLVNNPLASERLHAALRIDRAADRSDPE